LKVPNYTKPAAQEEAADVFQGNRPIRIPPVTRRVGKVDVLPLPEFLIRLWSDTYR